jgi:hypothetical protein
VLDSTDLRMALVTVRYYLRAHELIHRPPPPAALRLADHLTSAMSANGQECVGTQPDWLTTRQAAHRLHRTERHARRIAQRVGTKIGSRWLIPADALEEQT